MRIVADLDLCQGHQMCQLEAPTVLGFDPDADKVAVLDPQPADDLRDELKRAVAYCPAMALTLMEE